VTSWTEIFCVYNQEGVLKEATVTVASAPLFQNCREDPPFESFALSFCIVLLKGSVVTQEPHLSSEASHMFVKKQELCANVPKGAPQQLCCVDKEQFKIK